MRIRHQFGCSYELSDIYEAIKQVSVAENWGEAKNVMR